MPCCNLLRGCFIYTSLLNITTQPAFALCFAQNNNLYGDIVTVIVANAIMLNILIVEQTGNTYKLHLVKPMHDIGSSILHRTLILHKKNDHYDAIVPSSQSAYVTTPPCSARILVSHASPNQDNASIISLESIACKSSADNDVECNTINSHVRDDEKRLNDNCILKGRFRP